MISSTAQPSFLINGRKSGSCDRHTLTITIVLEQFTMRDSLLVTVMVDDTTRRKVLLGGGTLLIGGSAVGVPSSARDVAIEKIGKGQEQERGPNEQPPSSRTVPWDGQRGAEHAMQECSEGEFGYWHFVLTRGGRPPLEEENATLEVTWEDTETKTFEGSFRGQGAGTLHFDVFRESGGTVEKAVATFSGGGPNALLTISEGDCVPDDQPPEPPEAVYWQVDFGAGPNPPIPPRYYPDDGMFALGSGEDGVLENPSYIRTRSDGQLNDVTIEDRSFSFDDTDEPTEVSVTFTVDEGAPTRDLHLAAFTLPGPFTEDEIDDQELFDSISDTYEGGDSDTLTVALP